MTGRENVFSSFSCAAILILLKVVYSDIISSKEVKYFPCDRKGQTNFLVQSSAIILKLSWQNRENKFHQVELMPNEIEKIGTLEGNRDAKKNL